MGTLFLYIWNSRTSPYILNSNGIFLQFSITPYWQYGIMEKKYGMIFHLIKQYTIFYFINRNDPMQYIQHWYTANNSHTKEQLEFYQNIHPSKICINKVSEWDKIILVSRSIIAYFCIISYWLKFPWINQQLNRVYNLIQ